MKESGIWNLDFKNGFAFIDLQFLIWNSFLAIKLICNDLWTIEHNMF
jgi:hypothetical protein